jgi:hypothetical protein
MTWKGNADVVGALLAGGCADPAACNSEALRNAVRCDPDTWLCTEPAVDVQYMHLNAAFFSPAPH